MKITCPNCASDYSVADDMLGPNGRKVKCATCAEVWLAIPEPPDAISDDWGQVEPETIIDDDTATQTTEDEWPVVHRDAFDNVVESEPVGASGRRAYGRVRLKGDRTGSSVLARILHRAVTIGTPVLVACGLIGLVLAVPFRESVVSVAPDLARLYGFVGLDVNVRGITFAPVNAERSVVAGLSVLTIEGAMTNADDIDRTTAPIRFALLAEDGAELFVWRMDPPVESLVPGQTIPLVGELTAPPEAVASVSVRFLQQDEAVPGQVF